MVLPAAVRANPEDWKAGLDESLASLEAMPERFGLARRIGWIARRYARPSIPVSEASLAFVIRMCTWWLFGTADGDLSTLGQNELY